MALIPAWSYSGLKDFEKCPFMAYLKRVEKRPDTQDKTAANRGTMVHDACEAFLKVEGEFIPEMKRFVDYFKDLKVKYESGIVSVEEEWGFTKDWTATGWFDDDIWCRMKLDNFIHETEVSGTATDYKTGKKYGNEVSHNQQGQLYALGALMRYPELEVVNVEFLYLDHGQTTKRTYTREKAMKFLPMWNKRALKYTESEDFPPKPSKVTCMWCPYGPQNGDGSCEWGV